MYVLCRMTIHQRIIKNHQKPHVHFVPPSSPALASVLPPSQPSKSKWACRPGTRNPSAVDGKSLPQHTSLHDLCAILFGGRCASAKKHIRFITFPRSFRVLAPDFTAFFVASGASPSSPLPSSSSSSS